MQVNMLSHRTKRFLLQLLPFGIIPAIFSVVYALLEKGILGDNPVYPSTGNPYSFRLIVPAIMSMGVGLVLGAFEILYINKWFQKRSFTQKIIFKAAIYFIVVVVASLSIVVVSDAIELGVSPLNEQVLNYAAAFLSSFAFWSINLYFIEEVTICLFYVEVSDIIGQAV